MRLAVLLLVPSLVAFAPSALAADGVEADRPDLAEGPAALAPRAVQAELGMTRWLLGRSGIGEETLDAVGELLVRVGLAPGWEGRLGVPSWYRETRQHPAYDPAGPVALETTGFGDVSLGFKRDLPSPHARVETGLIAEVSLPVGEAPFGGADPGAAVTFAAALETGPGGWCANVGLDRTGDATSLLATLAFERPLVKRLSAFAEIAWMDEAGASRSLTGAGLLWLVAPGTQLDARVGGEFAGDASHPLYGFGLVRRW